MLLTRWNRLHRRGLGRRVESTFLWFLPGRFLYHPLLPLPDDANDPLVRAQFSSLEPDPLVAVNVRDKMLK